MFIHSAVCSSVLQRRLLVYILACLHTASLRERHSAQLHVSFAASMRTSSGQKRAPCSRYCSSSKSTAGSTSGRLWRREPRPRQTASGRPRWARAPPSENPRRVLLDLERVDALDLQGGEQRRFGGPDSASASARAARESSTPGLGGKGKRHPRAHEQAGPACAMTRPRPPTWFGGVFYSDAANARRSRPVAACSRPSLSFVRCPISRFGMPRHLIPGVLRHQTEALGLDLAHTATDERRWVAPARRMPAVQVRGENEGVPVCVCAQKQHRSSHCVQRHQVGGLPSTRHPHRPLSRQGSSETSARRTASRSAAARCPSPSRASGSEIPRKVLQATSTQSTHS